MYRLGLLANAYQMHSLATKKIYINEYFNVKIKFWKILMRMHNGIAFYNLYTTPLALGGGGKLRHIRHFENKTSMILGWKKLLGLKTFGLKIT